MYNRSLHIFAVFTATCTFFLIIAGGLVTSTGSGLAVPDWPLSYGQVMPPMVGGIFYEHGHRMVATFVGSLTVVLAVWLWKKEERRWVRMLGLIALGAVIAQGVLGGLTVLYLLPTAISVSHATLAQTFFCTVASIGLFTSKWWIEKRPFIEETDANVSLRKLVIFTTLSVYVQLILGALMRHTQSGLAVPDFPLAYGRLFPSLDPASIEAYNRQLIYSDIRLAADGPISAAQVLIHMFHRIWAFVVAGFIIVTAIKVRRIELGATRFKRLSTILLVLLLIQISLGAWTVLSRKAFDITTVHVATGALILVVCVLTTLHVFRLSRVSTRRSVSFAAKEITA